MKNLLAIIVLSVSISACTETTETSGNLAKFEEKHEPFDHFYFQRAFPNEQVDFRAMEKSLQDARRWSQRESSRSTQLAWQQTGPLNIGGRINCIAVHPFNNDIILTGTAGGGIFRTEDGGDSWEPITDDLTHLPIGHIVFDPTDPNVVYAGTGDVNIGGTVWLGNGVYKSSDGGNTWSYLGLEECRIVSKIAVNPQNPQQIFVGTMGVPFEANNDRGLYRTNDGGMTWEQVLFVSDDSGIIDLVMNPENPAVLYAANFNRIRTALYSQASGDEAGIYKTTDGGNTWTELTNGLPSGPMSRIGLKLWEGNPNVLFAKYVNPEYQLEGIFKSTNSGASFSEIPTDGLPFGVLGGFGWYFGKLGVSPFDQNEISLLGVDLFTTTNNGQVWNMSAPDWWQYEVHADKHAIHYVGPNEILLATDGGLYRTEDGFQTWSDVDRIPNTQFYRLTTNPHFPGMILAGAQDNGTSVGLVGQPEEDWLRLWGGDGFTPIPDPIDPTLCYTTTQYGNFYYLFTDYEQIYDWDNLNMGIDGDERVNWDAPFLMDPAENTVLYTATERVYRMNDAPYGIWQPISPVLVGDGEEFFSRRNVSSLAVSPLNSNVIYAGTTDSKVWVTENAGNTWDEVDGTLPEFYVTDIKAAPYDEATAFVTFSGYRENDNTPHLYRTEDYGQNWEPITGDLPQMPINHVEILNELVYFIATDNGVYITENGGTNWQRLGTDMPYIVVLDLHIDFDLGILLAGTFARSVYTYDLESILLTTSVDKPKVPQKNMLVYPNPASDVLTVEFKGKELDSYTLYNAGGKQVRSVPVNDGSSAVQIYVDDLPAGLYLLSGFDTNGAVAATSRVIVE